MGSVRVGVLLALGLPSISYAKDPHPRLVDAVVCSQPERGGGDNVCVGNLSSFIAANDGRKRKFGGKYGFVDQKVTPKEYGMHMVDAMLPLRYCNIIAPPCPREGQRKSAFKIITKNLFSLYDINEDGVISKRDDLNGDNMITIEDKVLESQI